MDKLISDLLAAEQIDGSQYFVAVIDGSRCRTWKEFLKNVGKAFQFPTYYGMNSDAFYECINDLEWIDQPNYLLVVRNAQEFLCRELAEDRTHLANMLNEISEQWANVPNYEGEDEFRRKADFRVRYI